MTVYFSLSETFANIAYNTEKHNHSNMAARHSGHVFNLGTEEVKGGIL